MNDALDLTPELQALVEQLGTRDRNAARAAQTALASRGEAGIAAVLWGLSHPNSVYLAAPQQTALGISLHLSPVGVMGARRSYKAKAGVRLPHWVRRSWCSGLHARLWP